MALSPMMQHYLDTKEAHKDCVLFYRLGDFYEMFFDDAVTVSRELELTLTGKSCGLPERAPMCGVPFHAADIYIAKLVERGYKVAICEQVEDPKEAKGMVRREVVRIVTPGTVQNAESLDEARNNYIMCIAEASMHFGIALADITTGQCLVTELDSVAALSDEILKYAPSEIICNQALFVSGLPIEEIAERLHIMVSAPSEQYFDAAKSGRLLREHFRIHATKQLGIQDFPCGEIALGALFCYLYDTQKSEMRQMTSVTPYYAERFMLLDEATRRNLELVETIREKQKRGSLLWVLDKTRTAMGARMLRRFIEQPLIDADEILQRQEFVTELVSSQVVRDEMREYLKPVYDLERLAGRIAANTANPRDLLAFSNSLQMLPHIRTLLTELTGSLAEELCADLDPLEDLEAIVRDALVDDPPLALRDGGIIRSGFNEEVDRYREAKSGGQNWLADLEQEERERTGIKTLRIKYNKVFGYCIEVTNSFKDQVPEDYIRRQTLVNAERYTTARLKEMEETILGAEERLNKLEYELFCALREQIGAEIARIQRTASAVAKLDAFASLAYVAAHNQFVRPAIRKDGLIRIREGRHPVVECIQKDELFIPNDSLLDLADDKIAIITGPNMAGKSTYMRQCALIVLMAQIGSFVPALEAEIGIADRIFTRVGASDDLASGKSTFMVEMNEVANILRNATKDSLLILDEIGRGTSTYDGLSIAWAVVEHIASSIGARTLFATHYHELTELEGKIDGVRNYCIAVKERGREIVFLRKIIKGGADKSYGIQVARLAGVPEAVLARAEVLARALDEQSTTLSEADKEQQTEQDESKPRQLSLFDGNDQQVIDRLKGTDLSTITPIEAMNLLYELQRDLK